MELYKKYRPSTFNEVLGNKSAVDSLRKMVESKEIKHTILFSGPSGCGKTTLARILANEMQAEVLEMNLSDKVLRGIDGANDIIRNINAHPLYADKKVIILDEVDQATKDWQKAMKKPLEDTPNHIYFFLCTTMPEKLIKDIHTRSTQIQVELQDTRSLTNYLDELSTKESKSIDKSLLRKIADASEGSVRKAVVFLDQILSVDESKRNDLVVNIATQGNVEIINLCRALMQGECWENVSKILSGLQEDAESIRYAVLGYCNSILLRKRDARASEIIEMFREPMYVKAVLTSTCFLLSK